MARTSKNKFYGNISQNPRKDDIDGWMEEIQTLGYTVIEQELPENELVALRKSIDDTYQQQEDELGEKYLSKINEKNVARALLVYDECFLNLVTRKRVLQVVRRFLGDYFILNLQNAIISHPDEEHHQGTWHRDLPYQNFVISQPIAINVFYCIDEFSKATGATEILPYTHKMETLPSNEYIEEHKRILTADPGSVIVFDSMVLHRAGYNTSNVVRRGINHIFSFPIMKQQYDFPAMLKGKYSEDEFLNKLLGYDSQVPASVAEWRENRHRRLQQRKQQ